jgi:hypothetical protein
MQGDRFVVSAFLIPSSFCSVLGDLDFGFWILVLGDWASIHPHTPQPDSKTKSGCSQLGQQTVEIQDPSEGDSVSAKRTPRANAERVLCTSALLLSADRCLEGTD